MDHGGEERGGERGGEGGGQEGGEKGGGRGQAKVALFVMPNSNQYDIISISIFCKIPLLILIEITIFSRKSISILISI